MNDTRYMEPGGLVAHQRPVIVVQQPSAGHTAQTTLVVLGVLAAVFIGLPIVLLVALPLLLITWPVWFPFVCISNAVSIVVGVCLWFWEWSEDKS